MVTSAYFCVVRLIFFILCSILFTSCETNNSSGIKAGTKSREALLMDSVARFPDSLIFRENLVQFYRDSGHYNKAIEATIQGIKTDSMNARLYEMLAILHFEREDTAAALTAFEHAVNIQPVPQYMISLGTLYAQTKDPRAVELMDVLVREYPKFEKEAWFVKGLYRSAVGDFQNAIVNFDKALNISFTFMEAYREKSIALNALGLYNQSLEVINKAVTLQNNYEEGYYYKGKVLEKLNRPADAIEAYRSALMYAPDYIEAREALNHLENKK
ncbi:MAG: tetratricopeptide repeat protein [Chitinophagaceae bacterium]|nr:MAG: tetratricopeptide repeat protein [Chitinophagaceae bacterium]